MSEFRPDYNNIVAAAKNIRAKRIPLYEHAISESVMEKIMNREFAALINGNESDKKEYFRNIVEFFKTMGYDTVSYEWNIGAIMPGSGALGSHTPGVLKGMDDFLKYPWDEIPGYFFEKYAENIKLLGAALPEGTKAIGGPGYGVFEIAQDLVGYEDLCILSFEEPEFFEALFVKVGETMYKIWNEFLERFGDIYAVCRFGDDLGFKSATLIRPDEIRRHIIPQYKKLVGLVHSYNKPFLLHSCGNIFCVMEDLINEVKIDAKHSNEDQIAHFPEWVDKYGDRIGNFGGVDTDHLCRKSEAEIKQIVRDVYAYASERGGFALGSGNSIPHYVPAEGYLAMVEETRRLRGE